MATQIKDYLADLDELMKTEKGADWVKNYDASALEDCKKLTGGDLNFLSLVKCGAMVGYYNVDLFNELGLEVPTTIEEFKAMSDTIKTKKPDIIPVAFAAKEVWVSDEMMLTLMIAAATSFKGYAKDPSLSDKDLYQICNRYIQEGSEKFEQNSYYLKLEAGKNYKIKIPI